MIRILHVVSTMDLGGVETLLMSIYRKIDRNKMQFDFLCLNTCENYFSEEIHTLGGKMYALPFLSKVGYREYKRSLYCFFCEHREYNIIHSHINHYNGIVLEQAKKAQVPVRISHCHISKTQGRKWWKSILEDYFSSKIEKTANIFFACSNDAVYELYRKKETQVKCIVMNNAIDTGKFRFNIQQREKIRKDYQCEDKYVAGHIGRFSFPKNQKMIIELAERISSVNRREMEFWLIGEGKDKEKLMEYVQNHKLNDVVKFLGPQSDVPALLAAMDIFLFPSNYEGLGIVAIEAQASGLPVLASDTIPKETEVTDLIRYFPLGNLQIWEDELLVHCSMNKSHMNRKKYADIVNRNGYGVDSVVRKLQNFYSELSDTIGQKDVSSDKWKEFWEKA